MPALLLGGLAVTADSNATGAAQHRTDGAAQPVKAPSLSLAPSVIMLTSRPGEAHTRMLRITNGTGIPLAFELVAQDVVVQEGTRVFLPAGETEHSAAATAVFSRREIVVPPGETASVDVTITVPPSTAVRAIAAIFRGKTVVSRPGAVAMTASLGSLITFTLSSEFKIEASPLEIGGQSNSANVSVSRWLKNTGSEPVIPSGAVAVMTRSGALVGKTPIEPQRLLPGERLRFVADCPAQLRSGSYRAVVSLQYEGRVITDTADFTIL